MQQKVQAIAIYSLGRLLRELDPQDQVVIAKALHLLASLCSIRPVRKADERKALCPACLSIFRKEDSGDSAPPLEHVSDFRLLGPLAHLSSVSYRPLES